MVIAAISAVEDEDIAEGALDTRRYDEATEHIYYTRSQEACISSAVKKKRGWGRKGRKKRRLSQDSLRTDKVLRARRCFTRGA